MGSGTRLRKDEIMRLDVLKAMLELGAKDREVSTADIQEKLFGSRDARSPERRKLQRVLNSLENEEYLESEGDERGRKGKRWRIKRDALRGLEYLSEEERRSLMMCFIFLPIGYKSELVERLKYVLSKVSGGSDTGSVLSECIGKYVEFEERYTKVNIDVISKILEGLERRVKGEDVVLRFGYNNKQRIVVPLKLFSYEGLIQLTGWELSDEDAVKNRFPKSFVVAYMWNVEVLKLEDSRRFGKIYESDKDIIEKISKELGKSRNFPLSNEEPFIFEVKLERINEDLVDKDYKISPSQIGKIDPKTWRAVLVGYTSTRYAFRFLNIKHVKRIIKPTEKFFNDYIDKAIKEGYEDLPKDFKENLRRFNMFVKKLKKTLEKKSKLLSSIY